MKKNYRVILFAAKKMQYHEFLTLKTICQSKEIEIPAIFIDTTEYKITLRNGFGEAKRRIGRVRSLILLLTYVIKTIVNRENPRIVIGSQKERALTNNGNPLEFFGTKKSKKLVDIKKLLPYHKGDHIYTDHIDSPKMIKKLREYKSDLIFRYGFGIIPKKILDIPKDGVIGFHHGDLTRYRGGVPCVWEIYNNEEKIGVTVQRLREKIDSGEIILQRFYKIRDDESINEIVDRIFLDSVDMGIKAILKMKNPDFKPVQPKKIGKFYTLPSTKEWLKLHCINLSRIIKKILQKNMKGVEKSI